MSVSVIVPVHGESQALPELVERLLRIAAQLGDAELVIVDDASTDGSPQLLETLAQRHAVIRPLLLPRRLGKSRALEAGMAAARGEFLLMLDGDLQNAPEDLPGLLAPVMAGMFDLVVGRRVRRRDSRHRVLVSGLYNRLINGLSGMKLHDHNCGLKAMRRDVPQALPLFGEWHRYLTVLAHWNGFRVGEVEVPHHSRRYGRSRYGLGRYLRFAGDLLALLRYRQSQR